MIYAIRTNGVYAATKPVRDEAYLRYVRQFPCIGCGTTRRQRDAMHIGPHGIGQKASDLDCLPGCRNCHRELHKIGPEAFQEKHGIEFPPLQRMIRRFYRLAHGTPDHWPNMPELTMFTCSCRVEQFTEELMIAGKCECGREYRKEKAA